MAEEMVAYSMANIIAQVGEAMIAQANASKQQVLALLQ
jgi:flagellin